MKIKILIFLLAIASALIFAICPSGSNDCFNCGGVNGIACTTNCTGQFDKATNSYISCACPQGKPCVCYCPYSGGQAVAAAPTDILANAKPCLSSISSSSYSPSSSSCTDCAIFKKIEGTAAVFHNGEWCIASENLAVAAGDEVWVTNSSKASLMFFEGSKQDINENSMFKIKSIEASPPSGGVKRMVFESVKGIYHYMISTDRIEQFEIRMDSAVIGIKGTEFIVEADNSNVEVKVLEGVVNFSNSGSSVVNLNKGQFSIAKKSGGAPTSPVSFDISSETKWWSDLDSGCCGPAAILVLLMVSVLFYSHRSTVSV